VSPSQWNYHINMGACSQNYVPGVSRRLRALKTGVFIDIKYNIYYIIAIAHRPESHPSLPSFQLDPLASEDVGTVQAVRWECRHATAGCGGIDGVQIAVGYVIRDVHMLQAGSGGVHEGQRNKRAAGVQAAVGSTGCGREHGL
jgi:hypothetical protein